MPKKIFKKGSEPHNNLMLAPDANNDVDKSIYHRPETKFF